MQTMKLFLLGILHCLLIVATLPITTIAQQDQAVAAGSGSKTYTNPLPVEFGDPYVLYDGDGKYFMYGTGGGAKEGFAAYSSSDLINWKFEGQVFTGNTEKSWSIGAFWAPEVYKMNNKYYMFYSAQWRDNPTKELENFRIGVAVSEKPTGPFMDISDKPIFDPGYPIIDANVFTDDDGTHYLYYSRCCY